MAFPSLFFSILAMPLLFVFLREYFDRKISLILMAIMSISYFSIVYSRFSSNPNITPFFVLLLLYTFLKVLNRKKDNDWLWFSLMGMALGIGIQLHTTLLVILPFATLAVFAYLFKKYGGKMIKGFFVVLAFALILNSGQIANEIKTDGANTKAFFKGIEKKSGGESFTKRLLLISSCQARANSNIISSLPTIENCSKNYDLSKPAPKEQLGDMISSRYPRRAVFWSGIVFSILFSLFGYALLVFYFLKEKEEKAKNFLGTVLLFNSISLVFLFPITLYISINYFIFLFFVPFVLLGLFYKFLTEKFGNLGRNVFFAVIFILLCSSFMVDRNAYRKYANGLNNNVGNSDLEEVEEIFSYMLEKSSKNPVLLSGRIGYVERFSEPLVYFFSVSGKEILELKSNSISNLEVSEVFYIQKKGSEDIKKDKIVDGFSVTDGKRFKAVDVYFIKK